MRNINKRRGRTKPKVKICHRGGSKTSSFDENLKIPVMATLVGWIKGSFSKRHVIFKGYPNLLMVTMLMVFCFLGGGEALRYGADTDKLESDRIMLSSTEDVDQSTANDFNSISASVENLVSVSKSYLRKHNTDPHDDISDSDLKAIGDVADDIHTMIELRTSDDTNDRLEMLKDSARAISQVKDHISDPELISSMPREFHHMLKNVVRELSSVENHVNKIEDIASGHSDRGRTKLDIKAIDSGRRIQSNEGNNSGKRHFKSGISKADFYTRARTRSIMRHGSISGHHQGYFPARLPREEGGTRRRLQTDNSTKECVAVNPGDRKEEQCLRLASCARHYNLYDLFVFLFGDDINFDTGEVDDNIIAVGDLDLNGKLVTIKSLSDGIVLKYNVSQLGTILDTGDECDQLLQEFYRFDESLSVQGKWQGGTVTGICRGWGTNNFITLESIYQISIADTGLSKAENVAKERVEVCLQNLVQVFNNDPLDFVVPNEPCKEELGAVTFQATTEAITDDIKKKFDCLYWSYVAKNQPPHNPTCILENTNCGCASSNQADYRGNIAVTSTGKTCQAWNSQSPHPHSNTPLSRPTSGLDSNYCRNPDNAPLAWCYTTDTNARWEFCTVPNCDLTTYCSVTPQCDSTACIGTEGNPTFALNPSENLVGDPYDEPYWNYNHAAWLPTSDDRARAVSSTQAPTYGKFLFDSQLGLTAEKFMIDVFNEYIGCATRLINGLEEEIFASSSSVNNPYTPDPPEFKMPFNIAQDSSDEYGRRNKTHLDEVFVYGTIGTHSNIIDNTRLNAQTVSYLAAEYKKGKQIEDDIEFYDDCKNDRNDDVAKDCKTKWETSKDLQTDRFNQGLSRSSLDASIALLFGNETTIGQVCAYANGLEDKIVDDVPGFCCLDAPYESDDWGEKYECLKYEVKADGGTRTIQKNGTSDCIRLGPATSGFNEAACDIFHGSWCPSLRDCNDLVNCIREEKDEVEESRDRQAFAQYLRGAPDVTDPNDPAQCGELREYFAYDQDYPDDDRICEEVRDLQCFTDFSNLDGFATGTAGAEGKLEDLAVSETLIQTSLDPFDGSAAKLWRNLNFGISTAIEIIEFFIDAIVDAILAVCTVAISMVPGTSGPCTIPATVVKTALEIAIFASQTALSISEHIYAEIVDGQDGDFADDRQKSMYRNIITNHGNIITTFAATQQLKVMLGEISEGMENNDDAEESGRRLSTNKCKNTIDGFSDAGCGLPSCEEPTRWCDGGFNFPYISELRGAGCDGLDSDGSGDYDDCEDRFPPELIVRDAEIFRCDEDDSKRLCHDRTVFENEKQVKHFLEYQFPATDDCSPTKNLKVNIEHQRGSCRDTVYTLTPVQNISACIYRDDVQAGIFTIKYENPLRGNSREVAIHLDDKAPVIQCGFHPDSSSTNKVDGKTLYHYMLRTEASRLKMSDAGFFYNVTDNCEDDVHVNVVVNSNEIQENDIAKLSKYKVANSVEQPTLLYAAASCDTIGEDWFCRNDPTIQSLKVRFYDITVTATDSAGNTGSDTCKVIIVPSCTQTLTDGCEEYKAADDSPSRNSERSLQLDRKLVRCYELYTRDITYQVGDLVSMETATTKNNYKCISDTWCGKVGYGPGEQGEILSWEKNSQECSGTPVSIPGSSPTSRLWSGNGCPEEYKANTQYDEANIVSVDKTVYQCAESLLCRMITYQPGTDQHWDKAWKIIGGCFDDLPPMDSPSFEALHTGNSKYGCPKEFSSGVRYEGGNTVTVNNRVFRCKAWPYSGHCSQAGYKPLTNPATPDAWKDAWDFIGYCNFYYKLDVVDAAVAQSRLRNQVAEAELIWEHGLEFPYY